MRPVVTTRTTSSPSNLILHLWIPIPENILDGDDDITIKDHFVEQNEEHYQKDVHEEAIRLVEAFQKEIQEDKDKMIRKLEKSMSSCQENRKQKCKKRWEKQR